MNDLMFLRAYRVSIKKSKSKSLTGIVAVIIIIILVRFRRKNTKHKWERTEKKTFGKYDTLCIGSAQYSIELHKIISLNGYRPLKLNQFEMVRQYFFLIFWEKERKWIVENHYDKFIASCVCLCCVLLLLLFVLVIMQMLLK